MKLYKVLVKHDKEYGDHGRVISFRIPQRLFASAEDAKQVYGPDFVTLLDDIGVDLDPEAFQS